MRHTEKWSEHRRTFGLRVKTARHAAGLSMTQLADVCGISKSYLHEMENGSAAAPSIFIAYELSQALGVSMEHLMGLTILEPLETYGDEVIRLRRKLARIRNLCDEMDTQ